MTFKGGALYYVIFVVFIITSVSLLFLSFRYIKLKQMNMELQYFSREDDLKSAITLYLSKPSEYQDAPMVNIDLYGDSCSNVRIERKSFGLFDIVTATVPYRGTILSRSVKTGKNPFNGDSVALYVPDKQQSLFASGNSLIRGNACIPAKGIKRASIEGKSLQQPEPVVGKISTSRNKLPDIHPRMLKKLRLMSDVQYLREKSLSVHRIMRDQMDNPFKENTIWYGSDGDFQISGIEASGNIGFVSRGTIMIRNDANLDGVLVSATNIIVEDQFTGEIQAYARDTLVTGAGCNFDFPSVLCVFNENVNPVYISLGENARIDGVVIVNQQYLSTEKPKLVLKPGCLVVGSIHHYGMIENQGTIWGSLYCEGFYRRTKRAYYENHLLDNIIDYSKIPGNYVGIDLTGGVYDQVLEFL